MKLRLNLYTHRFQSRRLLLDRRLLLSSVALVGLVVLVGGLWMTRINQTLAVEHQRLLDRQTDLEARMLGLSSNLESHNGNEGLLGRISEEQRVVNGKRQLINRLAEDLLLTEVRFSSYLRGLSESHVQGLWLTRIQAESGHLILDGRSLSEELVPQWIQQLSKQTDFRGKHFGILELSRQKDGTPPHLDFHLSTQLQRNEQNNG